MKKSQSFELKTNTELKYHKIMMLVFFIITAIPIWNSNIMNYTLVLLGLGSIGILMLTSNIRNNPYITWSLAIGVVIFLSIAWSVNNQLSIGESRRYILTIIIYGYLALLVKDKKDFYTALKLFILSRFVMLMYIVFTMDINTLGEQKIGVTSLGEGWNANGIGMNLALSAFAATVLIKGNTRYKVFYYFVIALFSLFTLLTGSRKALFILVFSIFMYNIMTSRKKMIKNLLIYSSLFLGLFYLIMNNAMLYQLLGLRVEGLLASFTGTGEIDSSTYLRKNMIDSGLQYFKERPITGYGINNFREIFGRDTGGYYYSHNNFVELLVGLGIFGTVLYYYGYYYILKKSLKNVNNLTIFGIVSIITILIIDYGLVSYNSYYIHFFICLSFSSIFITDNEKKQSKIERSI